MDVADTGMAAAGAAQASAGAVLRFKRIRRYLLIINVAIVAAVIIAIALLVIR